MAYLYLEGPMPPDFKLGKYALTEKELDENFCNGQYSKMLRECAVGIEEINDPWNGEVKSTNVVLDIQRVRVQLPTIILGRMTKKFMPINQYVVPIVTSDARVYSQRTIHMLPTMPTYVPELGVATQLAMRSEQTQVYARRIVESFIMEKDYVNTAEGKDMLKILIEQAAGGICVKIGLRTWESILQVGYARAEEQAKTTNVQTYITQTLLRNEMCLLAHKHPAGLADVAITAQKAITDRQSICDTILMPKNRANFISYHPLFSTFMGGGEEAAARIMDGKGELNKDTGFDLFRGLRPREAPSMFDGHNTHYLAVRISRVGLYTLVQSSASRPVRDVEIYSQYNKNYVPIDANDMTEHAPLISKYDHDREPRYLAQLIKGSAHVLENGVKFDIGMVDDYSKHKYQQSSLEKDIKAVLQELPKLPANVMDLLPAGVKGVKTSACDPCDKDIYIINPSHVKERYKKFSDLAKDQMMEYLSDVANACGYVFTAKKFVDEGFDIALLNPLHTFVGSPIAVMQSGESHIFGSVTEFLMESSSDAGNMSQINSTSCSHVTVIRDPNSIEIMQNTFIEGTVSGANATLVNYKTAVNYMNTHFKGFNAMSPCWYVLPLPKRKFKEGPFLSTLGRLPMEPIERDNGAYKYCDFYAEYYGFRKCNKHFNSDMRVAENTIAMANFRTTSIVNYKDGSRKVIPGNSIYGQHGDCASASGVRMRGTGLFPSELRV